jgi:hypothetical protein
MPGFCTVTGLVDTASAAFEMKCKKKMKAGIIKNGTKDLLFKLQKKIFIGINH